MKCPFAIPIRKPEHPDYLGNYLVLDGKGRVLIRDLTNDEADYFVQAINSQEKLLDVCRNALTSLAITMLPRLDNNVASDNDIIKVVISSLQQALKEAGKK